MFGCQSVSVGLISLCLVCLSASVCSVCLLVSGDLSMCQSVSVGLISLCPCCLLVSHGQSVFVCQSVPFGLSVSFVYLLVSDDLSVSQSVSFGFPVCLLCLSVQNYHHD